MLLLLSNSTIDLTQRYQLKGTIMQIKKKLWLLKCVKCILKFHISTIYNFVAINPWNLLFLLKEAYFLTVFIVFSVCTQTLYQKSYEDKFLRVCIYVKVFKVNVYFLLYNLHECTLKSRSRHLFISKQK